MTYGQIMMFSASSAASASELKAALSASFNSFAGGGGGSLSVEQQQLLQSSEIKVVTLGGSEQGVADLIRDGDPSAFFRGSTVVTSSVPIGYTLKDLHGNTVKVGETAEYGLTTCSPNGFANVYVHNSGSEGFTSGYYGDGTRAELANESMGTSSALDIVYDDLDDRLYVLDVDWGNAVYVDIFEANGERPSEPVAHGANNFTVENGAFGMAYDPINARLYVVGNLFGGMAPADGTANIARAWTTDGFSLDLSFNIPIPEGSTGSRATMRSTIRSTIACSSRPGSMALRAITAPSMPSTSVETRSHSRAPSPASWIRRASRGILRSANLRGRFRHRGRARLR